MLFYLKDYSIHHRSKTLVILITIMNTYATSQKLNVEHKESFKRLYCSGVSGKKFAYTFFIRELHIWTCLQGFENHKLANYNHLFILENSLNFSEKAGRDGRFCI